MKFGKLTALALAGTLTFAACKYEEGPRMSLRAKRDRVANEWKVVKFELDGQDLMAKVNPVYTVNLPQQDSSIIYEFMPILDFYRTGGYGVEIVLVRRDANNNPKYVTNHGATAGANLPIPAGSFGFDWLPGCSAVYHQTLDSLPAPFKYIMPHGNWSFDKGHYKIQVKPDLGFVNDETGNAKNTLDWTIVKLAQKSMKLKGWDENNKLWKMELSAINKENYFY